MPILCFGSKPTKEKPSIRWSCKIDQGYSDTLSCICAELEKDLRSFVIWSSKFTYI